MRYRKAGIVLGAASLLALPATRAQAHWCDDLWASSYNITVRPDSDASPKEVYVQNNMGYQLTNFKLTASTSSGSVSLTAPATLKVAGTLLPGEKGTWKISGSSPAKIEDIMFDVSFGNSGQSNCYPTSGAMAVMIVRKDGSLSPQPPPPGLASPANPGCVWDSGRQGRSLQYSALADWEDLDGGIDKLLNLYCAGRGSWGSTDGVTQSNCKDSTSTSCPTTKPTASPGSKYDYMHLWAAGELAIRKGALGARLSVFRERLKCGVNDGDMGFAGYAMFLLGYLGDDPGARSFAQTQASAGGDLATIAKAALYMMGDTAQKADVQAGVQSNSVFVKAACAAALGIVDKDDATVTSALIPQVKWNEPDTSDDGKGLYAGHLLELAAFQRRGWVANGVGDGVVTFYGETGDGNGGSTGGTSGTGGRPGTGGAGGSMGSGGASGSGGTTTNRGGSGGRSGAGGIPGSGGRSSGGVEGSGGSTGPGSSAGSSGVAGGPGEGGSTTTPGSGGVTGSGAAAGAGPGAGGSLGSGGGDGVRASGGNGDNSSGGATGDGSSAIPGGTGGDTPVGADGNGCSCNLGERPPSLSFLAVLGLLGLLFVRRRRS
jgi:MYXO-CTERM domain-containing protein